MSEHTNTPWVYSLDHATNLLLIQSVAEYGHPAIAAVLKEHFSPETCDANAAFIVRAVNAHDDLVAACKKIVAIADAVMARHGAADALGEFMAQACDCRAALAKATA